LRGTGVGGKIILKWNRGELDLSGSEQGQVVGSCEHGNEPSAYIQGGEFLDQLSDWYLLKTLKAAAPLTEF
jgi:hypothetical protein